MTHVCAWIIPKPEWRRTDQTWNFIQETTGQGDPLLRAGLQPQMFHLRGCQGPQKSECSGMVSHLELVSQRNAEDIHTFFLTASFTPGCLRIFPFGHICHLTYGSCWPEFTNDFTLANIERSSKTHQLIYSLPAKPVKILTWKCVAINMNINLSQACQGLRLVYSYVASTHVQARLIPKSKAI